MICIFITTQRSRVNFIKRKVSTQHTLDTVGIHNIEHHNPEVQELLNLRRFTSQVNRLDLLGFLVRILCRLISDIVARLRCTVAGNFYCFARITIVLDNVVVLVSWLMMSFARWCPSVIRSY